MRVGKLRGVDLARPMHATGFGTAAALLVALLLVAACGVRREASSSAGGLIAFTSNRDGNVDVYVMAPDGSGQRRLTHDPAVDEEPSWSPDGKRIAFTSERVESAGTEVFVMNADGSDERQLTSGHPGGDRDPAWSPDGSMICFRSNRERAPGTRQLPWRDWVMNADGSGQRHWSGNWNQYPCNAAKSPDGRRIAFVFDFGNTGYENYVSDLNVMNVDGSGKRRLTTGQQADRFAWSPDSRRIAFESTVSPKRGGNGTFEIYVITADGSRQQRLTWNSVDDDEAEWSPDGTKIAFSRQDADACDIAAADTFGECNDDIYVMNADGSEQRRLTDNRKLDAEPAWSP